MKIAVVFDGPWVHYAKVVKLGDVKKGDTFWLHESTFGDARYGYVRGVLNGRFSTPHFGKIACLKGGLTPCYLSPRLGVLVR